MTRTHRLVASIKRTWPLTIVLFTLWVILSEKFDPFHLGIGVMSAVCIATGTQRLLLLAPEIGPQSVYPFQAIPWLRLVLYIPWLCWQIVLSSIAVAAVVLHPKMPIDPTLVRFQMSLPHPLAQLTLATSITLTPGTVTLDVENDMFLVHALTTASARDLVPESGLGAMPQRVAALYATSPLQHSRG